MKHALLILAAALLTSGSVAQISSVEKPVTVQWDPPAAEDVELVSGYNVYQVTITPPIRPAKYDVNLVTPLPPGYTLTYTKLNTTLIPAGTLAFTILKATPGMQLIVRGYTAQWDFESQDSDILTLRPLPGKAKGLKAK